MLKRTPHSSVGSWGDLSVGPLNVMNFKKGMVALTCGAMFCGPAEAQVFFPEPNPPYFDGAIEDSAKTAETTKSLPAQEWTLHRTEDGSHPDGREQEMVWLMNRARSNPTAEGGFLATTGVFNVISAISFFHVDLALLRQEFAAIAPKPPAAFDRRLYTAALAHCQDLIARNAQDHNGQFDRVLATGFPASTLHGSVFSYAESPLYSHAGFNIDWGGSDASGMQAGRGHRAGLMSDTPIVLSLVGISLVPESNLLTAIGPLVNTINYGAVQESAGNFNRYLVGTVWTDSNLNGRFDAGEGKGGIRVSPSAGTYYAITTASGGYALPLTADGNLEITFTGGTLPAPQTRGITVGSQSMLLDFDPATAVIPILPLRMGAATFNRQTGQLSLNWSGGTGPYQLQHRSSLSNSWENVGAATASTTTTLSVSGTAGFYRIQGR